MSCGLGAVILIFLIIKHEINQGTVEADILLSELEVMERQEQQLQKEIKNIGQHISEERRLGTALQKKLPDIKKTLAALGKQAAQQQRRNEALKSSIEKIEVTKAADVVPDESVGEEEYLTGMRMEGERIAILVDHSASMTDEKLVDIVVRKIRDDAHKKKGPKWQRTKKVVRWLLNRLPEKSKVAVIAFNDNARVLGEYSWHDSKDARAIKTLFLEIEKLVPTGATNLQAGLNELNKLHLKATAIYLITDGLPTKGVSRSVRLGQCGSLLGKSNNISGECREKLFKQTLKDSAPGSGEKVNVLLLPLEGDPAAAPNFWIWAAATGGLMLTPAAGWP